MGTATALTLRGRSVVSLRAKLPLLADGAPTSWVEMAYESAWKGHHSGAVAFTPEVLACIVERFAADENPIPVTYGHPEHSTGQPVPAAGWIREMEVRTGDEGAELWGLVEWTATAAQHIRAGEYRYCSVVVDFAPIDRATGESAGAAEMYELGLTNSPFLPGMTPITLSRVGEPARSQRSLAMDPTKILAQISKALGLPTDASPDKMKRAFDALVALMGAMSEEEMPAATVEELAASKDAEKACARLAKAAAKVAKLDAAKLADDMFEAPAEETTEAAGSMVMGKLVTATGLDEAAVLAGVEANLDAIAALITGTPAAGLSSDAPTQSAALAREADAGRIAELSARANEQAKKIAALEADLAKRTAAETEVRIAASFARLVAEGKAGESERATFLSLSARNEEIALSAYDTRAPVLPPTGSVVSGPNAAPPKNVAKLSKGDPLTETYRQIARSEGLRSAKDIDARAAVLLSKHADTRTDA